MKTKKTKYIRKDAKGRVKYEYPYKGSKIISLRVSNELDDYLKKVSSIISESTGLPVDKTWLMKELMKEGQNGLEKRYGIKSKKRA
jgi:hypothetical protein